MVQESTIDRKKKKRGSEKVAQGGAQTHDDPEIKLAGQLHFSTCSEFPKVTGYRPLQMTGEGRLGVREDMESSPGILSV